MSASLNEAAMAGSVEEVTMRLNLGEDVNQKLFPRSVPIVLHMYFVHSSLHTVHILWWIQVQGRIDDIPL